MRQLETFYCPKVGHQTSLCDDECTYSPCGFKNMDRKYHTSVEMIPVYEDVDEFLNDNPEHKAFIGYGASFKIGNPGRKGCIGCSECMVLERISKEQNLNIVYNNQSKDNVGLIENP